MMDLGVATIHQELSPVLDMSIAENIFSGTGVDVRRLETPVC